MFSQFSPVKAYYWCADAELSYATCDGTAPYEGNVDTSTPGQKTFTVVSYDAAGNRAIKTGTYTVHPAAQTGGTVGGTVPATLSLTMGTAPVVRRLHAGRRQGLHGEHRWPRSPPRRVTRRCRSPTRARPPPAA